MLGDDEAWDLLRALRRSPGTGPILPRRPAASPGAVRLLELYLPFCEPPRGRFVVAHLAQSLDGCVATRTGESRFITGDEDLRHTHRMRALFDAVLVGATTVALDDPRLTTRLVPGDQPARVVLDPNARLPHDRRIFTDGAAATFVVVGEEHAHRYRALLPRVEVLALPLADGRLPLERLLHVLGTRGLSRIFVEGGGVTVSRFLEAGLLDCLQVAVAPTLIRAAPALDIPSIRRASPDGAAHVRTFVLGQDVLFDWDLRAPPAQGPS